MGVGVAVRVGAVVLVLAGCGDNLRPAPEEPPGVVYTFPADFQIDVPLGAPIIVTFSEPVERSALTGCVLDGDAVRGGVCVVGPDGLVTTSAELVGDGRIVRVTGQLAAGSMYAVHVDPAVLPNAVNLPSGPLARFTMRSTRPRAAPPKLVAIDGAPAESPGTFRPLFEGSTIRLVFSEPLDPRSVALAPGAIELVEAASGNVVPATLLANGIHVSIDPRNDLGANRPYHIRLGDQLTDLGGQRLAPAVIAVVVEDSGASRPIAQRLRTRITGDPGATRSRAGGTANEIAIANPLIGAESSQMLPGVLAAELGDPAREGPIGFVIRRGQRLRASGLDVKLGGELPAGLSTGEIVIELVSDAGGRLYRNPHRAASQVPDNDFSPLAVDLTMDIAMYAVDPTGSAVLSQTVLGVQASGTAVATEGVLDLEAVVSIDLGLLGVTSAPTNLVLELITDLEAALPADNAAPMLLASLAAGTAGELEVDSGLELVFSEAIDLDRARSGGVVLETQAGQAVASVLESRGAALVIRPVERLADGGAYRVRLDDVADLAGNRAPPSAIGFVTPPLIATTAPATLVSIVPGAPCALVEGDADSPGRCAGGQATDQRYRPFALAADQPIDVRFTQPPIASTIVLGETCTTGSVRIGQLDPGGGCAPVAGTLIRRARGFSFMPDAPWQIGARYRLTLISGSNAVCDAGELCGPSGNAASFDPLTSPFTGNTPAGAGGPDLVVEFVGAPASDATRMVMQAAPFSDGNGSGVVELGELGRVENRVVLQITGTTGALTTAEFHDPDCVPDTPERDGCMFLSGAMPVDLRPLASDCALPGGERAARCMPVALTPQTMYATEVTIDAGAVLGGTTATISARTGRFVLRLREPAAGPIIGYLISPNEGAPPELVVALDIYLDAPDMSLFGLPHDLHSKPIAVTLRGPLRFLGDGRIALAVANTADIALSITIQMGVPSSINMRIPEGGLTLRLVSPPLRGGL